MVAWGKQATGRASIQNISPMCSRVTNTQPDATRVCLDLLHRLCDRFNRWLSIDSEPDNGTIVWLQLMTEFIG